MKKTLGLACTLLALAAGCYKHSYTVGSGGNLNAEPKYSSWESHWFFGIIGESEVDVKKVCPSGNATIKDKQSFLNGLVAAFIGIVWAPTTVEVYCAEGKTAAVTVTPEQMRSMALDPQALGWAKEVSSVKAAELEQAVEAYRKSHKNVATGTQPASY